MIGSILKGVAYTKAPRATFGVLHPREAFELVKLPYDMRHAYAPRITGAAALALALPLGIALGKRLERRAARRRNARTARAARERVRQRRPRAVPDAEDIAIGTPRRRPA